MGPRVDFVDGMTLDMSVTVWHDVQDSPEVWNLKELGSLPPEPSDADVAGPATPAPESPVCSFECDPIARLRKISAGKSFRFRVSDGGFTCDIELFYLPVRVGGTESWKELFTGAEGGEKKPFGDARLLVYWEGRWLPLAAVKVSDAFSDSWLVKKFHPNPDRLRGIVHTYRSGGAGPNHEKVGRCCPWALWHSATAAAAGASTSISHTLPLLCHMGSHPPAAIPDKSERSWAALAKGSAARPRHFRACRLVSATPR